MSTTLVAYVDMDIVVITYRLLGWLVHLKRGKVNILTVLQQKGAYVHEHHDYFFCPPSSLCVATYDNHKSRSVDTGLDLHASTTVVGRDCIAVAPFLGFLVVNDGGLNLSCYYRERQHRRSSDSRGQRCDCPIVRPCRDCA
jgi:hypothetical protein